VRCDAIVIGAGLSGLAAALRLALFERSVVLLERHTVWGGLNSFYTLGGRPFDVGLHALTNYAPAGARGAPLTRVLRALRIRHEELRLGPQGFSEIVFPGARLSFTNDFAHLRAEVERLFPGRGAGLERLATWVREYSVGERDPEPPGRGARAVLARFLAEPLLEEMLLLPVLYYGSATEQDCDEQTLAILFRALFLEGLSRPEGGIRTLLNLLIKRVKRAGVDLRLGAGVRRILVRAGQVEGVELESGEVLEAPRVLSSAGALETRRLAGLEPWPESGPRLSFLETIWVLDRPPAELGLGAATAFYSTRERFSYRRPQEPIDVTSGVLSSPNNFAAERPLPEGQVRVTVQADHAHWSRLAQPAYGPAKEQASEQVADALRGLFPDWRGHTRFRDVFTPRTIERFTGHVGGAVYGSPEKRLSGECGLPGLALLGTDQGYLGIVGALTSGVAMANRHVLMGSTREALSP